MVRKSDWTLTEFKIVLANPGSPSAKLADKLPTRSGGAIGVIQEGIHSFHRGANISMLSRLMRDYLEENKGSLVCPVCGRHF